MRGLHRWDDPQGVDARLIIGVDDLRMLDAEAVIVHLAVPKAPSVGGASQPQSGRDRVHRVSVGQVTDGVDIHLEAAVCPRRGCVYQLRCVDKQGPRRLRSIRVRVDQRTSPTSQGAICVLSVWGSR